MIGIFPRNDISATQIIIIIIIIINSSDRIAATLYFLGTLFVSGIYV
jgi:hypothetical protein